MVRFCVSLVVMLTLAACGGGGGGGGETVSQPAGSSSGGTSGGSSGGTSGGTGGRTGGTTPPPTEYTVTQSTSSTLLKTFTDGVRVYRLVDRVDDGDIYVGYVENAQLADKLLKITSQTNPAAQQDGNEFTVNRQATVDTGETLNLYIAGLSMGVNEYVSRVYVESADFEDGYMVNGTGVDVIPIQNLTYSGVAEIGQISTAVAENSTPLEKGTFTLTVDFTANGNPMNLSASTANYQFASSDMTINTTTGAFQSNSAGIGTRTGATQSADVFGSLFGTDAKGVGGVVRSQSTTPQAFIGAFYGNR